MKNIIELTDVSKVYGFGQAATHALDGVNLTIQKGEFVAIMGPSGSGKSTLMNIMGLLDRPTTGVYRLEGEDVSHQRPRAQAKTRRNKIGFIFQSFNLLPRLNAIDNVALPLVYQGKTRLRRLKRAEKMLKNVDLENRQFYKPNQLSGGQVQRVAVARALVNKPAIVLADEPTGNLDTESSANIMELLSEVHQGGNTIVMVTHNPDLAQYAERIITMVDGKVHSDEVVKKKAAAKQSAKKTPEKTADAKKSSKSDTKSGKKSKKSKKATKKSKKGGKK